MKKLLTTLVLLSSFFIACDLPYEEISGVKIGCPLSEQGLDINKTIKIKPIFFDYGTINQENNQAKSILFYKEYSLENSSLNLEMQAIKSDTKMLSQTLESRWGFISTSTQFDKLFAIPDYSKFSDRAFSVDASIDNSGSKIVNKISLLIQKEEGEKSPIMLFVIYDFFDQSKREQMKGM